MIITKEIKLFGRESILIFFLCFGLFIILSTEILSVFNLFRLGPVCLLWGMFAVVTALILKPRVWAHYRSIRESVSTFSGLEKLLVFIGFGIVFLLGILAVYMPPNTWDAMTYHMGRVAHWIQNGTVAPYPTNIQRQLVINPFAEYWIAHFQLLSGGRDYLANSVQWISMVGTLVGISLIAKQLGLSRLGQILSIFFVVTLPNAVVQATSTQTDFVASLWCVSAISFMIKNIEEFSFRNTLAATAALAIAFYTKGSIFFILVPFLAWMFLNCRKQKSVAVHVAVILLPLAALMFVFFYRNYHAVGSAVFPGEKEHILALNNVKGMMSNILLHVGMHLKFGIVSIDTYLMNILQTVHHWMGFTIETSPANISTHAWNFVDSPFYEDIVPNFLFTVIYLPLFILFFFGKKEGVKPVKAVFFLLSFLCFIVFNALIRWSPFDGRYHLPFFILFSVFLADHFSRHKKFLVPVIVLCVVSAAMFLLFNCAKPIFSQSSILAIPRPMRYFYNQPDTLPAISTASKDILNSNCQDLGLDIGEDTWEYPWWVYLHNGNKRIRIEHVLVTNASRNREYPLGKFDPCLIISRHSPNALKVEGKSFNLIRFYGHFSLYVPSSMLNK